MYAIRHDDKLKAPDGTGYNDFPVGWHEVEQKEVVEYCFRYVPGMMEYRQMLARDEQGKFDLNKPYVSGQLFWFVDGTGYAVVDNFRERRLQYFRFGCAHEWRSLSQAECHERKIYHAGKCYHVSECTKCRYIDAVDSSD